MEKLLLNSLEISGFRCFERLKIEKLDRINLIIGKNNVGKTAFLEALRLYARRARPSLIWEILELRDEVEQDVRRTLNSRIPSIGDVDDNVLFDALKYLFYGRVRPDKGYIQIGSTELSDTTLSIRINWYPFEQDEQDRRKVSPLAQSSLAGTADAIPRFAIQVGELTTTYALRSNPIVSDFEHEEIGCVFIGENGLTRNQIARFWDNITLSPLQEDVLASLQVVAPGITGLSVIGDERTTNRGRTPIVRVTGVADRLPLRSLGAGMQRMLGIALSLVNTKDGMLLIDEIESGLHYSVQYEMWQLIFNLAHRLNVQVFATTHSRDCIKAFQMVTQENEQIEAMLIRLNQKETGIDTTLFDKRRMTIAVEEQIEVR